MNKTKREVLRELIELVYIGKSQGGGMATDGEGNRVLYDPKKWLEEYVESLLKEQKAELKEKVEGMKWGISYQKGESLANIKGFNQALDQVLDLLKE